MFLGLLFFLFLRNIFQFFLFHHAGHGLHTFVGNPVARQSQVEQLRGRQPFRVESNRLWTAFASRRRRRG